MNAVPTSRLPENDVTAGIAEGKIIETISVFQFSVDQRESTADLQAILFNKVFRDCLCCAPAQ
jgi:hypothetical protein